MRYYEKEYTCIDIFREEYEFLSNFYPCKMELDGITYHSAEAAYQAQKCINEADRLRFAALDASGAKALGHQIETRADWDECRIDVMRRVVAEKFRQHPELAAKLVSTGEMQLIEGNYWHDVFWGADHNTGEGENHLGEILMELRCRYQNEGLPETEDVENKAAASVVGPINGIVVTDEDITLLDVDCIVNAANKTLMGGSGVDGAIHREAGPRLREECRALNGCETGEAKITGGYNLKAKYVIHTVGPVYRKDDSALLEQCYRNSLNLAKEYGIHSMAFPSISTGKFKFPKEEAVKIAFAAVESWKKENADYDIQVVFSCVDPKVYQLACEALQKGDGSGEISCHDDRIYVLIEERLNAQPAG